MSLGLYNRKRRFSQTPEPRGKTAKKASRGGLRFVVQMHDASRLHFDFRLEFDAVFKSWAVPKGPSLNPLDQRLAVLVEDHPLAYGSFEGIIPKGNYGGGTVMIWDEGSYCERGSKTRIESEALMRRNFAKGHLTFVLDGEKLRGEFALIKLKGDKKNWLLVKKRDEYSTYKRRDIPSNTSVKTGRTLEQITAEAEAAGEVWLPKKGRLKSARQAASPKKQPLPRKIKPMLPIISRQAPDKNWICDPLPNGLRAIAEVDGKSVSLYSKAGLSFTKKYPSVVNELKSLHAQGIFDGAIVGSCYVIFDILYWAGRDLRQEPLHERRKIFETALAKGKYIQSIIGLKKNGPLLIRNPESTYRGGTSSDWRIVEGKTKKKSTVTIPDEPRLTHPDKVVFPDDGLTKSDVFEYYRAVAPYLLPYLKDRPESLNRHPNGIDKPGFYQKDMAGYVPRWLKTERVFSESASRSIDYAVCQDERSLLYLVNLGCIEFNPWLSRVGHLDNPDYLVIDLDPDENQFDDVIQVAHQVHEILDAVGAANFCKTSGATGIHIGVPLQGHYIYDQVREFAEVVCRLVAKKNQVLTSVERTPARRRGKIYMDYLQNRRGQTLAAPFCLRPRPGAPVSMPLTWNELRRGLRPEEFNIKNALKRIGKFDDPWRNVLSYSIDLTVCAKRLDRKFSKD